MSLRIVVAGIALLAAAASPSLVAAQPDPRSATSLDELLDLVRAGNRAELEEYQRREAEFRAAQEDQQKLLEAARAAKAAQERRSEELEIVFEENEGRIPELQETLRNRLGTLGELFGVVRQVAGDARAVVGESVISAQLPGRAEVLSELSRRRELPSADDLRRLWFTLQQEMTESGKVVRFAATVVTAEGRETQREVIRVGSFNVVSEGKYLQYLPSTGQLAELGRQPASRHLASIEELENAERGLVGLSIDPSRGSILSLLIQTPSVRERVQQGGIIGYITIVLGVAGFLLVLVRLTDLAIVGRTMSAQAADPGTIGDNPLGRVFAVFGENPAADVETLELKLDEAILKETPRLERGNNLVKVLSVVAPLLGLLGTVTGMIQTFQSITLFGTGDPKLMAGGISQALVTTVLGLSMAIPLVLFHSVLSSRSRALIQILEEQSAGIIAAHAERHDGEQRRAAVG